jgi:Xaa-Pro aminopeptidase
MSSPDTAPATDTRPAGNGFAAIEAMPAEELALRHARVRAELARALPDAAGLMAFSRPALYWLSGHLGNGAFWLPMDGAPVLLCRRGIDRARLESPLANILPFRSYSDLPGLLTDAGSPLPDSSAVAAETSGLPWSLGTLLTKKLPTLRFVPGDAPLARARSVKTAWELDKMRLCGERHHRALHDILPGRMRPGMTERELSIAAWGVFFELGHSGHMRMNGPGDEIFLGHVSAGENANYPSVFNGPVGLMGDHPSLPFMGYAGTRWNPGEPLVMDIGFCLEGYATDKTQVYWSGPRASIPARVAAAHEFCVSVQAWLAENMKPGAIPSQLYEAVMQRAEKEGWTEGFMALGTNKVSFLGHGIGLAIDEHPVIAKGFDDPLEEGVVMALEPKLGIPGVGMVGVENTFEVTPTGARCITGAQYEMVCID